MPNQIENRFLGLRFDNAQFERAAAQSIQTLGKLKESLALKGAETGASNIQNAFSKLSFNAVNDGLNTVTRSFSTLEQISIGALRSIGAKVEALGSKLIKNLGIDQFITGWQKYNNITQSIQTIMAALPDKTIEEVTEQMEKLNWFSDETSYSLTDMTNNVAKFTSAGIKLEDATNQMMGIAAAAALAGSGVQNASHAMSGFSKAIGQGYMDNLGWSYIQTAKMDTMALKQAFIDAGIAAGTLKKTIRNGSEYVYALDTYGHEVEVTAAKMRTSLSTKWMTKEVMLPVMNLYGDFSSALQGLYASMGNGSYYNTNEILDFIDRFNDSTDEFKEGSEEFNRVLEVTGLSAEELSKSLTDLGSSSYKTGRDAFKAAQEAITLRQAWDALADAVSTNWMKTFQLILGNYEEAKTLWTNLSNFLNNLFATGGYARNDLLEEWHFSDTGGYKDFAEGLNNLMEGILNFRDLFNETFGHLVPNIDVSVLTGVTTRFKDITANFKSLPGFLSNLLNAEEEFGDFELSREGDITPSKSSYKIIKNWADKFHSRVRTGLPKSNLPELVTESLFESKTGGRWLPELTKEIDHTLFDPEITDEVADNAEKMARRYENLASILRGMRSTATIVKNVIEGIGSALKTMFQPAKILGADFLELFGAIGRRITDISQRLVGGGVFVRFFRNLGTEGGSVIERLVNGLHKFIVALTELIDPAVESSASSFLSTVVEIVKTLWSGIGTIVQTFAPLISSFLGMLKELFGGLAAAFKDFFGEGIKFTDFTNRLKSILDVGILGGIFALFKKLNSIVKEFKGKGIGDIIKELINGKDGKNNDGMFSTIKKTVSSIGETFKTFTKSISESLAKFTNANALENFANSVIKIAAAMLIIALIPQDKFARATVTIAGMIAAITGMFYAFSKMNLKQAGSIAAIGTAMAGIGTGLLFIAGSLIVLALIPENKIEQGLHVITVALLELTTVLGVLAQFDAKRMLSAGVSILFISTAIDLIAVGLAALALVPKNAIDKGLRAITIILVELTGVLAVLSNFSGSKMLAAASSILVISAALDVMTLAFIGLALLPEDRLMSGVLTLIAMISAISTALALLSAGNSIGMLAGAAAMLIMAPAILIFTAALAALAFIPFIPLAGGLVILGVALAGIVAAAYLVTPVIPGLLSLAATFVAMGAGAVLLGAGLLAISVAVGAVVLIVAGGVAMIINALANLINSLRGTMEEGETEAAEGGTGISLSIFDAMVTAWNEHVHEIVDNMIAGLKEKVSAAWYRFKEIASSMANAVISGFKSALGIKSPSRVMAEEMGYVIAGMGLGVDRSTNAISDIGESMAQTLLDASDETFGDYKPSLTPVFDMSSVGSGGFSFGATLTPSAVRNLASVSADIRDQRESMNDYITAAVSSAINGMKDELTFVVPLEVDGRQFASSTARFTRSELNLMDRNTMRKGGLINA